MLAQRAFRFLALSALFLCSPLSFELRAEEPADKPKTLAERAPTPRSVEPPTILEIQQSLDRGLDFLIKSQNKQGWWGSATHTKDLNPIMLFGLL